jgi:hypothetical protein
MVWIVAPTDTWLDLVYNREVGEIAAVARQTQ